MSDDPGALRRRGYATNINDATDGLSYNRTQNPSVDNTNSTGSRHGQGQPGSCEPVREAEIIHFHGQIQIGTEDNSP